MRRASGLVALVLLVAGTARAGEIKIAWYGQSMFEIITPKGTRVVLDPHNIEHYRVRPTKADLVLMSHFHSDHVKTEVIENIKEAKQYNALKKTGPDGLVQDWNIMKQTYKDVRFESIGTYHDTMSGAQRGKNGCWILDIDGIRIVHLGDLGHRLNAVQLKRLGKVDVLMVPTGGIYTLGPIDAWRVCEQVKPRRLIIPMHYGTRVYGYLQQLSFFTDEAKEAEVPIVYHKPKEWLTIDTKKPAPEQATVAVLEYLGPPETGKPKDKEKKEK